MTPDRIKLFLHCFYQHYIETSYQGFEVEDDQRLVDIEKYDERSYFLTNLDLYIGHCDFKKEYDILYNPKLFRIQKETDPELFNAFEIFLIENIQLFLHTILEAVISKQFNGGNSIRGLKIFFKPIDNKSLRLEEMVDKAEEKMKALNVLPPAMG